ncbi:MAG: hypothetical protein ANABAC_0242 [Anaerolineae bacterium]|nr:MAG: hypothetical protein ANABAC_0242 [Anaerolineae bacterium]
MENLILMDETVRFLRVDYSIAETIYLKEREHSHETSFV